MKCPNCAAELNVVEALALEAVVPVDTTPKAEAPASEAVDPVSEETQAA